MSKYSKRGGLGLAFAGITVGLAAVFGVSAQASIPQAPAPVAAVKRAPHNHASDCRLVAEADRKLCAQVQAQHSYGAYYGDPHAYWSNPNGRALVHELTHDGMSKGAMHTALVGYAREYREWVTAVPVNMDAMVKRCGNTDGQWVVSYRDEDGKPGGLKLTYARIVCA